MCSSAPVNQATTNAVRRYLQSAAECQQHADCSLPSSGGVCMRCTRDKQHGTSAGMPAGMYQTTQ